MAVTEHSRLVLYRHFEAEMGEEKAQTLMDHLLPVGWTDLATKQDLRELEYKVMAEFAAVRTELHKTLTTHMLALVGTMVALQGIMLAGLKLL